jgi:hypothetical protein
MRWQRTAGGIDQARRASPEGSRDVLYALPDAGCRIPESGIWNLEFRDSRDAALGNRLP